MVGLQIATVLSFVHNDFDGHSLYTQTCLPELTIKMWKKEKKEEKVAFCKKKKIQKTTLHYKYLLG